MNDIGRKFGKFAVAVVLSLAMGQAIPALAANVAVNGSFENNYPGDYICGNWWYNVGWQSSLCNPLRQGEWGQTIPGWQETGEGVNWTALGPLPHPVPPDGDHAIDLLGAGKIEQSIPTTPGTVYTVSFLYARNAACNTAGVSATARAGASAAVVTPTATGTTPGDWELATFTFAGAAAPATTTTLSFEANPGNPDGLCGGVLIDLVSVDADATPPPYYPPVIDPPTLPDARVGDGYTFAFTAQGSPLITWTVSAGTLPAGLSLSPAGVLSGIPTAAGTATFTVRAANQSTTPDTEVVTLTVLPALAPPVITTSGVIANATAGVGYAYTFSATGTAPFTWSIKDGSLPGGLSLSPGGVLTGTPTTPGTYNFTVRVTNPSPTGASAPVTLTVLPAPPVINAFTLASAQVGVAYSYTFTASGSPPITWSLASGSLPAGMTLSSGGLLSGTPTAAGTTSFTIRASNASTTSATAVVNFTALLVPPVINPFTLGSAQVGAPYSTTFTATGSPPITWSVASGSLPAGVSLSSGGVLAGTPTAAGSFTFTIRASNGSATPATAVATLTVAPVVSPPVIGAFGVLADGQVGVPYSYTFSATGTPPITWSVASGSLPAGLTLSSGGALSGTPTAAGTFAFTIRATNAATSATAAVTLKVAPAPTQAMPETIADCKKDGWKKYGVFKNQGDCVSYVATHGNNPPAGQPMPKTKDDCKNGGWRDFDGFRSQSECTGYVESLPKSRDECRNDGWRRHGCYRDQGDCERDADRNGRDRDRGRDDDDDRDRDRGRDDDNDRDRDRNRDRGG